MKLLIISLLQILPVLFTGTLASILPPSALPNGIQLSPRPHLETFPKHQAIPHRKSPTRRKVCIVPSSSSPSSFFSADDAPADDAPADDTDDTPADDAPSILHAAHLCNHGGTILFPRGHNYTIKTALNLTFLNHVDIDIQGTIRFSDDLGYWEENAWRLGGFQNTTSFWMIGGVDVEVFGGGIIDGSGQSWYDAYAENIYILRPILLAIIGLKGGSVSDLKMRYSPQYYNMIMNSSDVIYSNIDIAGRSSSRNVAKNTDGWDIYRSDHITIQNSRVDNGDDCVSFKPNSTNILVQNLHCNGSHGISVGSLGQYPDAYDIVENIYVYNISMSNASDGARIKVWPGAPAAMSGDLQGGGGKGHVRNVTYDGVYNYNNDYAIEVTQCYGQKNRTLCDLFPSKLTISDIHFKNFWGTTSKKYDPKVGSLICSSPTVCGDIYAENITVTPPSGMAPYYACSNVDTKLLNIPCRAG